ncbi:TlpA family protein disulfide reductase [Aliikangiella sp. IMCC44359]|uniref:TlpA family protein disulfide reductase n=1 Tax=Aliikangiella sp. IMCC44359 TaxID=3459125 RepID=UPI00403ADC69
MKKQIKSSQATQLITRVLGILALLVSLHSQAKLRVFAENSLSHIKKSYQSEAFIMVLWSIECTPCRAELALLSKIKKQYPQLNIALIATNDINAEIELNKILQQSGLDQTNNWAFSPDQYQALKYQIDPDWYGEMPRSYFYNSNHQRLAISGKLTQEMIIQWIKQNVASSE